MGESPVAKSTADRCRSSRGPSMVASPWALASDQPSRKLSSRTWPRWRPIANRHLRLLMLGMLGLPRGGPKLASPTLRAALISGCHWLHVICPACETVAGIDLRVVRRDPTLTIAQVLPSLICRRCQPSPPEPKPLRLVPTFQSGR